MALLLSPEEVAQRVALYTELRDALNGVVAAQRFPEEVPSGFSVYWEPQEHGAPYDSDAHDVAQAVCCKAWKSLRTSALKVAGDRLRKAETAVQAFEQGDEV